MNDSSTIDLEKIRQFFNDLATKRGALFLLKKKMLQKQSKLPTDRPLTPAEIKMINDEISKDITNKEK